MANTANQLSQVQLNVYGNESAYPSCYILKNGETLFAGSGASCGIHLNGPDVEQFHCMFSLINGNILVQDCETGGKTTVNGTSIENEMTCTFEDTLTIGQFRIVVSPQDPETAEDETRETDDQAMKEVKKDAPVFPAADPLSGADFENTDLDNCVNTEVDAWVEGEDPDSFNIPSQSNNWAEQESFDQEFGSQVPEMMKEEMELLRSEIEFLQSELATKDQEIAELTLGTPDKDSEYPVETEKLVCRLEELLDELKISDERVKSLEDLLRLSEEANRAEQEEREQIESWLSEIESRVALRESELESEVSALRERVTVSESRQQKAEMQLKKVLSNPPVGGSNESDAGQRAVQLEQKIAQMERLVESANQARTTAEERLAELESNQVESVDVQSLEQKLIQMELETSRERATLARQKAELESRLEKIQQSEPRNPKLDDSDYRFAAMRDHLREIHEEEKLVRLQKQQNSLSGRISRLLKRT